MGFPVWISMINPGAGFPHRSSYSATKSNNTISVETTVTETSDIPSIYCGFPSGPLDRKLFWRAFAHCHIHEVFRGFIFQPNMRSVLHESVFSLLFCFPDDETNMEKQTTASTKYVYKSK